MNEDRHHPDDQEFEGLLKQQNPLLTCVLVILMTALAAFIVNRTSITPSVSSYDDPTGKRDVLATLRAAAEDEAERVILLLGDSVLRGNILRQNGFPAGRTVGSWARELSPSSVSVYDLSLDGILPGDLEVMVDKLDEIDPDRRVEVVIELTPRYLSSQYSGEKSRHAREWLGELDTDRRGNRIEESELTAHRLGLDAARRHLGPSLRHPERRLLQGPRASREGGSFLRVARHFLEADTRESSVQIRALASLSENLAKSDRRTLFFNTPVNGTAFGLARHPREITASQLYCRHLVRRAQARSGLPRSHRFLFRHFDDNAFKEDDFIDHCHLKPAANRFLAQRILQSLGVPAGKMKTSAPQSWIRDSGETPDDGFGGQAAILSAGRASFLDRQNLLVVEMRSDREMLRLVGLAPASVVSLDTSTFGNARVVGLCSWDKGRAILLLSDGRVMGYGLAQGLFEIATNGVSPQWKDADLVMARSNDFFVLHDKTSKTMWSLDADSGEWKKLFDVPEKMLIHSMGIAENGTVYVLTELDDDRPFSTGMHSLPLARFVLGDLGQLRTHFNDAQSLSNEAWLQIHKSYGLVQTRPQKNRIPIAGARRLYVLKPGHRVLVEAPAYTVKRASSPPAVSPTPGTSALWNVDAQSNLAYALLWPSSQGTILDERARLPLRPGEILAVHEESGRVFSKWYGWRTFETSDVMRFNWKYGVPPDPLSESVTAMGFTRPTKRGSVWRAGFFGSSITGAVWPFDATAKGPLVTSVSIARGFEAAARESRADSPFVVEGINMSMARCDIIGMYAVLLASNSQDLNTAVFCLDKATFGEPDRAPADGGQTITERWPAIVRDADGRPVIDRVSGVFPEIRLDKSKSAAKDRRAVIGAAMYEIVAYCRSQGITPVFLDLEVFDQVTDDPDVIPTFGRPGDVALARTALRDLNVMVIDAAELLGTSLSDLAPYGLSSDRHFRAHFLNALGRAMSALLLPLKDHYVFRFEKNERHKKFLSEEKFQTTELAARIHGETLSEVEANEFLIFLASTWARRGDGLSLTADVRETKGGHDRWRQALALFGRRAFTLARAGDAVSIELVCFDRYDEYGLGVRGTRQVLATFAINAGDLDNAARSYRRILLDPAAERPAWLKSR